MPTRLPKSIPLPRSGRKRAAAERGGADPISISRSIELPGLATSVAQGRRFVRGVLDEWHLVPRRDDAVLLTSELVTNAVLHGRGSVGLVVTWLPPFLEVSVTDQGRWVPRREARSADATTGRGLQLVERIATRCGTRGSAGGTTVWFRLLLDPALDAGASPAL